MSEDQDLAVELQQDTRYPVPDAERFLADMAETIGRGHQALELWRRWFREFGEPWFLFEDQLWCFFCDGTNEKHRRGCIYVAAERLLNE